MNWCVSVCLQCAIPTQPNHKLHLYPYKNNQRDNVPVMWIIRFVTQQKVTQMKTDLERIIDELCEIHEELRRERPDLEELPGMDDAISKLMDLENALND